MSGLTGRKGTWTRESDAHLRKLRGKRLTIPTIAARMGLSKHTVAERLACLGLTSAPSRWTPEKDQEITTLWKSGNYSLAALAEKVGCTRLAVTGRLARLGLLGDARSRVSKAAPLVTAPTSRPLPELDRSVVSSEPVSLLDIRTVGQCRWPVSDEPFMYCGNGCDDTATYCAGHRRIAYQPTQKKAPGEMRRRA